MSDAEVTREPTLPGLELPEYHGRPAEGMKSSLTGAGNRIVAAHDIGQRGVAVVEFEVTGSGHKAIAKRLYYVESLTVLDVFEVQGAAGARLLSAMRESYRTDEDTRLGRTALPMGDEKHADESGNLLAPPDLAALRGDPVAAMLDERVAPVVVVYSDGAREVWPDEFGKDSPRPAPGDQFEVEDGAPVYVAQLLNTETGETLGEWTVAQEDERLLAMEQAAIASEAAGSAPVPSDDGVVDPGPQGVDPPAVPGASSPDPDTAWLDGEPLSDRPYAGETDVEYLEGLADIADAEVVPIGIKAEMEAQPGPADFEFVDRGVRDIVLALPNVHSLDVARRLLEAEKQGRGRNLKPRASAIEVITHRITILEGRA
jgi:hypothetical protein